MSGRDRCWALRDAHPLIRNGRSGSRRGHGCGSDWDAHVSMMVLMAWGAYRMRVRRGEAAVGGAIKEVCMRHTLAGGRLAGGSRCTRTAFAGGANPSLIWIDNSEPLALSFDLPEAAHCVVINNLDFGIPQICHGFPLTGALLCVYCGHGPSARWDWVVL
ncbi:hypothetical protein K438DRAFT_1936122 [Mycena galopus ATCC 62051]|nr:hypothetical protein K438DRAFT_1936122 [Mycena galopus ATCC 62051]